MSLVSYCYSTRLNDRTKPTRTEGVTIEDGKYMAYVGSYGPIEVPELNMAVPFSSSKRVMVVLDEDDIYNQVRFHNTLGEVISIGIILQRYFYHDIDRMLVYLNGKVVKISQYKANVPYIDLSISPSPILFTYEGEIVTPDRHAISESKKSILRHIEKTTKVLNELKETEEILNKMESGFYDRRKFCN